MGLKLDELALRKKRKSNSVPDPQHHSRTFPGSERSPDAMSNTSVTQNSGGRRNFRNIGVCKTCEHHLSTKTGRTCGLLNVPLTDEAADELCHEHKPAGAG